MAPLVEELVEEILIRLPPDDPASLVRAALVCKPWRRLVSDPGFHRRFRRFHRTPPLLGFFYVSSEYIYNEEGELETEEEVDIAGFAPTSSSCPPYAVRPGLQVIDARHGRVLLHTLQSSNTPLVLWDPITDDHQELPVLPRLDFSYGNSWKATVLCAAEGVCDHLDCRQGPFSVVVVATNESKKVLSSYTYSSESGQWSEPSLCRRSAGDPHYLFQRGTLAENALYFLFSRGNEILKYDLGKRGMSLIDIPEPFCYRRPIVLMTTQDGRLGFAKKIAETIKLWTREVAQDRARWVHSSTITIEGCGQLYLQDTHFGGPKLIDVADGAGVFFMSTKIGLFMIDQRSGLARKADVDMDDTSDIVPYDSFYNPGK